MIKNIGLALGSALIVALSSSTPTAFAAPKPTTTPDPDAAYIAPLNRPAFEPLHKLRGKERLIPIPPDPTPAPYFPTKQQHLCKDWRLNGAPGLNSQRFMRMQDIHKIATGKGQTIAVIDTGVQPSSRLPHLIAGGDYIHNGNGLYDCSGHGTLVAGIIAATPSKHDKFVGVAPDARIIGIRVVSDRLYTYNTKKRVDENVMREHPLDGLNPLAHAITHAANMGATVINISLAQCEDPHNHPDVSALRNAILYAVMIKHAVIVSAAGNTNSGGGGQDLTDQGCQSNPRQDPSNPTDVRNYRGVVSVSLPSYFAPLVLSVGSTDNKAHPLTTSMIGPWVGVAAPGYHITSLNRAPGGSILANEQYDKENRKAAPIDGTSFAAPLVSGLAALLRERFPDLSPLQIINRIQATAHHPAGDVDNFVGAGVIDAKAALTANVPKDSYIPPNIPDKLLPPPPPPAPKDYTAQKVALSVSLSAALAMIVVAISLFLRKKN